MLSYSLAHNTWLLFWLLMSHVNWNPKCIGNTDSRRFMKYGYLLLIKVHMLPVGEPSLALVRRSWCAWADWACRGPWCCGGPHRSYPRRRRQARLQQRSRPTQRVWWSTEWFEILAIWGSFFNHFTISSTLYKKKRVEIPKRNMQVCWCKKGLTSLGSRTNLDDAGEGEQRFFVLSINYQKFRLT